LADELIFKDNKEKNKYTSSTRKWVGLILMIVSSLLIVFSIFPKFLGIGNFFYRIFGFSGIVIYLFTFLLGIANLKNMSFTASKKYPIYIFISYLSILCLLHLIIATKRLDSYYVTFEHFGAYLSEVYSLSEGISVGGASLSILVYFFRCLLGVAGSYVFYVIVGAIFTGLTIDYIIYSKSIEKRRNLYNEKTKKELEEKLLRDSHVLNESEDNIPSFSFSPKYSTTDESSYTQSFESSESLDTQNTFDPFKDDSSADENDNTISERELARKKLFEGYDEPVNHALSEPKRDERLNENGEPKSARELLFGQDPKLPDYFYTNDRAERDTQNFVNNYEQNTRYTRNNQGILYSEPTNTRTPNLDDNILNNNSVRSSWTSFNPEISGEDDDITSRNTSFRNTRAINNDDNSSFNNESKTDNSSLGRFNFNTTSDDSDDVTFTPRRDSTRNSINSLNISEPTIKTPEPVVSNKPEPPKPEKKVARQTNIYDDAPKKYFKPPLGLLTMYKDDKSDHSAEHQRKSEILNQVFDSFKIPAQVSNVVRGPKFTRYEVSLQIGVSVSKILQIEKNLEMALETDSGIRIEAPIPGKNAVGIEVKNDVSTTVGLRELLESPEYENSKHALPVVIGKNITGNIVVSSMDKMLHALVAGSTGSGKSVFIHSLILSLLYKCGPEDLRLIIIDPKQVDFVQYNGIPHLISPEVFYSYEQAVNSLTWSEKEMERRYAFLKQVGYSNIRDYNNSPRVKSGEEKKLPYILIIVDEFSNLMGHDKNGTLEVMITRITEKARAAGIHMVIATQRPSVDVITGVIKNNLPTRVALTLASGVDSKTIINEVGAEKLLGYGDMLFAPQDSNKKIRLQGAYCSDNEIKSVINYIKSHNISSYDESIAEEINKKREEEAPEEPVKTSSRGSTGETNPDKMDDLMPKCLELVMARGKATITMLQTKLSIGYSRAARIISQMEEKGFISDNNDGKPREVYISQEQYNELFGSKDEE